jgi:hypothetical protein
VVYNTLLLHFGIASKNPFKLIFSFFSVVQPLRQAQLRRPQPTQLRPLRHQVRRRLQAAARHRLVVAGLFCVKFLEFDWSEFVGVNFWRVWLKLVCGEFDWS